MSTFVIGALGFGLMQVLRTTQSEGSKVAARNETSRALDFISDEMRRAQAIEVDMATGSGSNIESVAPSYVAPSTGGTVRLALQIPGVAENVIYTVAAPPSTSPWKGPLVIYRWGPNLDGSGNYKSTTSSEALVDGVSDASQTTTCDVDNDGTAETITYQGFYACVVDNDGDSVAGEAEDSDGKAITAQLFFTGGTTTADGSNSTYSADTKAVTRARTAPGTTSASFTSSTMSFKTLNPSFACNSTSNWKMRTDFGESLSNPSNLAKWEHENDRQPQPIKLTGDTLTISSIPMGPVTGTCLNSRINNGRESPNPTDPRDFSGNKTLTKDDDWTATGNENVVAISHLINFNDPRSFNGDSTSCTAYPCGGTPNGNVYKGDTGSLNSDVRMLKQGSVVPNYGGYDANANNDLSDSGDQVSLGEFLYTQTPSLADKTGTTENPIYTINSNLKPDERIMGFEIGQTTNPTSNTGYDLQVKIFILKSDAFSTKYDKYDATNTYDPANVN